MKSIDYTYNIFAENFSNSDSDNKAAHKLTQAKKYVVTSGIDDLSWHNSVKINADDVAGEVARLKKEDGPLLQVHGSWQLIQTLLCNDLIDEFRLWTFPVVVGAGKRLFAEGAAPAKIQLTKFETCPSGAFMHFYQRSTTSS